MDSHKTWKRTVDSDDEIPFDSDDEAVHCTVHRVDSDDAIPDDEIPCSCAWGWWRRGLRGGGRGGGGCGSSVWDALNGLINYCNLISKPKRTDRRRGLGRGAAPFDSSLGAFEQDRGCFWTGPGRREEICVGFHIHLIGMKSYMIYWYFSYEMCMWNHKMKSHTKSYSGHMTSYVHEII